MMISKGYAINHSTITWKNSTPNIFVHLWSILERIKPSITSMDTNWLIASRTCVDYYSSTGIDGPMNARMYFKSSVEIPAVAAAKRDEEVFDYEQTGTDFVSYSDFEISTVVPKRTETLEVSGLYAKVFSKSTSSRPSTRSGSSPST
ncbi:hypothetical protein HO173_008249 [Letharia columbiana]|uniref:Uncharacterized protein n=1 Tax=Letharia columbiana TaxID=112416 RepID=A0A8H6FRT1_9LECA|nr:uncharacterized protein HO173_008249 [Letharia columbiana]KAF6233518.1 hypothetical protein HO173_008249 [Letharia columbiana]